MRGEHDAEVTGQWNIVALPAGTQGWYLPFGVPDDDVEVEGPLAALVVAISVGSVRYRANTQLDDGPVPFFRGDRNTERAASRFVRVGLGGYDGEGAHLRFLVMWPEGAGWVDSDSWFGTADAARESLERTRRSAK